MLNPTEITAVSIGVLVIITSYVALRKGLGFTTLQAGMAALAFTVITYLYLTQNPVVLTQTQARISMIMIGVVILLALAIKRYYR